MVLILSIISSSSSINTGFLCTSRIGKNENTGLIFATGFSYWIFWIYKKPQKVLNTVPQANFIAHCICVFKTIAIVQGTLPKKCVNDINNPWNYIMFIRLNKSTFNARPDLKPKNNYNKWKFLPRQFWPTLKYSVLSEAYQLILSILTLWTKKILLPPPPQISP